MIPEPWEAMLLALAAFRVWRLVGDDAILDRPRDWLLDRLDAEGTRWTYFLTCPWCAGFWIVLAWWGAWWAWGDDALVAATPFMLSAVVGYLGVGIDVLEKQRQ